MTKVPFGAGLVAGISKKDAFRRCITTMGHRHVRGRLETVITPNCGFRKYKPFHRPDSIHFFWHSVSSLQHRNREARRFQSPATDVAIDTGSGIDAASNASGNNSAAAQPMLRGTPILSAITPHSVWPTVRLPKNTI